MPGEDDHDYSDDSVADLAEDVDDLEAELEAEVEALAGLFEQQEAHIRELEAELASLRSAGDGDRRDLPEQQDGTTEAEAAERETEAEPEPAGEPAGEPTAAVVLVTTDERPPKPRGWLWRPVGESRVPLDAEREKKTFWPKQPLF